MSHYVKVQVALNISHEIEIVENILNEINTMDAFYFENFKGIEKIISNLKKAKEELFIMGGLTTERNSQKLLDYQIKIDSIMKKVGNMRSLLNYSDILIKYVQKKNKRINQIILEQGFQAIFAIDLLTEQNININEENLLKKINEIRNKEIELSKIKNIKKSLEMMLPNLKIPVMKMRPLYELIDSITTPQLATDVSALINNMVIGKNRSKKICNEIKVVLNDIGFSVKNEYEYEVTKNHTLKLIMFAYNEDDKNIEIHINTDGGLEYQMGNYEGHMCEADSTKFRHLLEKKIKLSEPKIIRNTTNNRPRLREIKSNIR